jgi:hypothetical protein
MYYVDNHREVVDNRPNQVGNRSIPAGSASQSQKLNTAKLRRSRPSASRADSKRTEEQ